MVIKEEINELTNKMQSRKITIITYQIDKRL